ncbi:MAG: hypothetical protein ACFFED_02735 [Candidatus Thorarchaeota archaeon]
MANSTGLRFIMVLPEIQSDGNFLLKDLPGSGKRIDILCRSLAACFDWAAPVGSTRCLELVAILSDNVILHFTAPDRCEEKGETWWASAIQLALREKEPPDFITITRISLEEYLLKILDDDNRVIVLEEDGEHLDTHLLERASQYSFMLGNHEGFDENTTEVIRKLRLPSVSLGAYSYLGSHCIAIVVSAFERLER